MPKNDLARRIQRARDAGLRQGLTLGQQFISDVMMVCLHRQGWGYERVKRLLADMDKQCDFYADAFVKCMEQDVRQEQFDDELRAIVKGHEPFFPFAERYPEVETLGYGRLPGNLWRDAMRGTDDADGGV